MDNRPSFHKFLLLLPAFVWIAACSGRNMKEKLNTAGEKAGEAVGEVVHGVSSGVESAFQVTIQLTDSLKGQGLELGKTKLSGENQGTDNLLSVYFIFKKDFNGYLTCKAFDNAGLEMGRTKELISGKAGEARFYDFHFDPRTNIDRDSKITLE